jgi:hypothetical protein
MRVMAKARAKAKAKAPAAKPAQVGQEIATHPLHFTVKPVDAPADAELVGMALIVAWSADRFGLPARHAGSPEGARLVQRAISPVTFLKTACASTLTTADIAPALAELLAGYTRRLFLGARAPERAATAAAISELLRLSRPDERAYTDDFLGTFAGALANPFYVPDDWTAVDRIAPVLDARWADYQATAMTSAPDLAVYQAAAARRDAVAIKPAVAAVAAVAIDAAFAEDLIAQLGTSVKDAKAALVRAQLPIGKRIDAQANPAAGVSYMGSNLSVGGKAVLSVTDVTFYADGENAYIRGLGKEVQFRGYPGPIVLGVTVISTRAEVATAFGPPHSTHDDRDFWYPDAGHRIAVTFAPDGALRSISFSLVRPDQTPPSPPFGPAGVF